MGRKPLKKCSAAVRSRLASLKREIRAQIRDEKKARLAQTTLAQRQDFLRVLHRGGKTIGEAADEVGIERDTAIDLYLSCLKKVVTRRLIEPEEVK